MCIRDRCCDYGKNTFVISVTVGKEQRQCRRISADMRIITKSLGNNKPVYISSCLLYTSGVNKNFATIINGWNDGKCIKAKGMKPKKKYTFKFYGKLKVDNPALDAPDGITVEGNPAVFKNVEMGPAVKPVIKSIKVSNVKVTKYFNYSEWRYKYKTKFTVTVTLGKKPKGAKGIQLTTTCLLYTSRCV